MFLRPHDRQAAQRGHAALPCPQPFTLPTIFCGYACVNLRHAREVETGALHARFVLACWMQESPE